MKKILKRTCGIILLLQIGPAMAIGINKIHHLNAPHLDAYLAGLMYDLVIIAIIGFGVGILMLVEWCFND